MNGKRSNYMAGRKEEIINKNRYAEIFLEELDKDFIRLIKAKSHIPTDRYTRIMEMKKKAIFYQKNNSANDWKEIMTIIHLVERIINLKKNYSSESNNITSMIYTTNPISIKTEYKIYHEIFGIPKNNKYEQPKLEKIRSIF